MEKQTNEQEALLQTLLANKDVQRKLRELMPEEDRRDASATEPTEQDSREVFRMDSLLPLLQSAVASGSAVDPNDPKNALLLALKPFLSEKRQKAVDLLLSLSSLGGIFGKI